MNNSRLKKDFNIQIEPPYDRALEGILRFASLADAEETLKRLDNLYRNYRESGDSKGAEYCRQIGRIGRIRAESLSRNKRIRPGKQLQKKEIASWFSIWLESPDIFEDWLALRKNTEEYLKLLEYENTSQA